MNNNSFLKPILFALTAILFASCDSDFNGIGSDLIGDNHFGLEKYTGASILAFNQSTGPVQSNSLPVNSLGIYDNPVFGKTTANFVTQLELATVDPEIGVNPEISSVVMTIPYFSTKTGLETDGLTGIYELDSIYGGTDARLKLSVYESGYFMRDSDPATQEAQVYYTNQNAIFDANKLGQRLNDGSDLTNNDEFFFSNKEHSEKVTATDQTVTTTRTAPAMRLNLNATFFKNKIITASSTKLANNNAFKEYFRGLYFKVEKSGASPTNLAMLNFKAGKITISYKEDLITTTAGVSVTTRVDKSIVINLTGNSANVFENEYSSSFTNGIAAANTSLGDKKLYLKGGEGAMTVINLFGNTDVKGLDSEGNLTNTANQVPDELDELRANKWLINDASLTFSVDKAAMGSVASEPNRVYLYDLNNKKALLDYSYDVTTRTATKYNKHIHGGIIEKGSDGRGTQYKIKLTNHIRNLIKNDTVTNVRLGLVVTENINDASNKKLKNYATIPPVLGSNPFVIKETPTGLVANPLGTILFGTNIPASDPDYAKRLKFEIYYTKPN